MSRRTGTRPLSSARLHTVLYEAVLDAANPVRTPRTVRRGGRIAALTAALTVTAACTSPADSDRTPSPPPTVTTTTPTPTNDLHSELSMPPDLRTDCGQLSSGDQGRCVEKLQRLLNARGAQLPVNGLFGEHTLDRVRQFQSARGLPITGGVADRTKAALYGVSPAGVDLDLRTDCVDLDQGAQGPCALSLQHLLIQYKQYKAPLQDTGTYGPHTTDAVRQFQHDHGLPTTGATHSMTKEALYDNLPTVAPPTQNAVVSCPGSECSVYLGRTTTASLADAFDKRTILKELVTTVVSQIACTWLKTTVLHVACATIVGLAVDYVIGLFQQGREDHTCVKVSFQPTSSGFRPAGLTHTDGAHCPS